MQMVSEAEAFGGRWATSPLAWLLLLFPVTLLVVIQDATTPFPSAVLLLGSALAQHTLGGGATMLLLRLLRLARPIVPMVGSLAVWVVGGALRGIVGGIYAATFAGVDPDFVYRVSYWIVATVVWGPLLTYVIAQIALRRALQTEILSAGERIHIERDRAHQSATRLSRELVASVREAVGPLIADVRSKLAQAAAQDEEIPLAPISERLESIANEARAIIDNPEHQERRSAPLRSAEQPSPLVESLTFDRSRPIFASILSAIALGALIVPEAVHAEGVFEGLECLVALTAGASATWLALRLSRRSVTFSAPHAALVFALGGVVALGALLAITHYPLSAHHVSLAFALPIGFVISASAISAAVGIANANLGLIANLGERTAELDALHAHSRAREERITAQVSEILHGPILGRLSACVMALNFYLAEPDQTRGLRRNATTDGVLAHLELITVDLEKLADAPGRTTRTL